MTPPLGEEREEMVGDPTWNFQDPASKRRMLEVTGREHLKLLECVSEPAHWNAPTACAGWDVRDMVGHLIDATEGYLAGFDLVRRGAPAGEPVGVAGMAEASDIAARAFRSVPRDELLARLRNAMNLLMSEFESVSDADWSGLVIPDPYLGPLPVMIVAAGTLGGIAVHGWDVREGLGLPNGIASDAADLLVPFVFLLWWATADTSAVTAPYTIGIRTTGHNGGDTRCDVSSDGVLFAPVSIDDCDAILECDPATLVLSAYNRVDTVTVHGDRRLATDFRSLFVSI